MVTPDKWYKNIDEYFDNQYFGAYAALPKVITEGDFKQAIQKYFVDVGVFENLQGSLDRFAQKLGKEPQKVPHRNKSQYYEEEPSPEAVARFKDRNKKWMQLWEYAMALNA